VPFRRPSRRAGSRSRGRGGHPLADGAEEPDLIRRADPQAGSARSRSRWRVTIAGPVGGRMGARGRPQYRCRGDRDPASTRSPGPVNLRPTGVRACRASPRVGQLAADASTIETPWSVRTAALSARSPGRSWATTVRRIRRTRRWAGRRHGLRVDGAGLTQGDIPREHGRSGAHHPQRRSRSQKRPRRAPRDPGRAQGLGDVGRPPRSD